VNGGREQTNQFYGAQNLIDGGRNIVNGINYTTWLSDRDARHWIKLKFEKPVEVHSLMLELTAFEPSGIAKLAETDSATTDSLSSRRPQEVALDLVRIEKGRMTTEKLTSTTLKGFRSFYPLSTPLKNVAELDLIFPGPSMVEVAEVELLGRVTADERR
jgi:hypothetical protein